MKSQARRLIVAYTIGFAIRTSAGAVPLQVPEFIPPIPPISPRIEFVGGGAMLRWNSSGPSDIELDTSRDLISWNRRMVFNSNDLMGAPMYGHVAPWSPGASGFFRFRVLTNPPKIIDGPTSFGGRRDEQPTLWAIAEGSRPYAHLWYRGADLVAVFTNAPESRLRGPLSAGEYKLIVQNPWGTATSQVFTIKLPNPTQQTPHLR